MLVFVFMCEAQYKIMYSIINDVLLIYQKDIVYKSF